MSQRERRLQAYWFLKLIVLLMAPGEIYPRKLSAYGLKKDRLEDSKMILIKQNVCRCTQNFSFFRFYWLDQISELCLCFLETYGFWQTCGFIWLGWLQ